jgi:predicted transposase YdaD
MSIFEYDEEEAKEVFREDGRIEGRKEGKTENCIDKIIKVLEKKNIINESIREKILQQKDLETLEKLFDASLDISSIEELEKLI